MTPNNIDSVTNSQSYLYQLIETKLVVYYLGNPLWQGSSPGNFEWQLQLLRPEALYPPWRIWKCKNTGYDSSVLWFISRFIAGFCCCCYFLSFYFFYLANIWICQEMCVLLVFFFRMMWALMLPPDLKLHWSYGTANYQLRILGWCHIYLGPSWFRYDRNFKFTSRWYVTTHIPG